MNQRSHPIRVLLVDDHSLVREGLKRILHTTTDIKVVAEAGTGAETLKAAIAEDPDLTLLDISLPDISGIDVLKEMRRSTLKGKVLVLTMHPEDQFAYHARKAGAAGYLTKESAPERLIEAINKIMAGDDYFDDSFPVQTNDILPHQRLSEREFQVFLMIAKGIQPKQMAASLKVSVKTINTYRARILEKMKFHSNAQVVQYAVNNKLL